MSEPRIAVFPERADHLPMLFSTGAVYGAHVSSTGIVGGLLSRGEPTDIFLSLDEVDGLRGTWQGPGELRTYSELPQQLARETYAFAHSLNPASLHRIRDMRDRYSPRPFPVTATCHTMSYYATLVELSWLWRAPTDYDGIVCISQACRMQVEGLLRLAASQLYPEQAEDPLPVRLEVIHHGVDVDRFRPRDKTDSRALLGLPSEAGIVLYVGRLSLADKMDLGPLLRAFRRLVAAKPERELLLVIAGEDTHGDTTAMLGQLAAELRIRDKVRFWGRFDDAVAPLLYGAGDVFVSLSDNIQEGFGNTVLEAGACGLPVIATDWNGYRDIVVDGESGWLIPTFWTRCDEGLGAAAAFSHWSQDHLLLSQSVFMDVDRLADRLRWVFDQPSAAADMGLAGRRRACESFAWPVIMRRYEAFWSEMQETAVGQDLPSARQALSHDYYGVHSHYATNGAERARVRLRTMPPGDPERVVRFADLVAKAVDVGGVPDVLREITQRPGDFLPFSQLVGIVQRCCRVEGSQARFLACALVKQGIFDIRLDPEPGKMSETL